MAKKLPPQFEARKFKKGQSGNPNGRPKIDPHIKAMRQLTAEEFAEIANLIIKGSIAELRAIAKDEKQSALRVMIAAVAVKTIQKGDMVALDVLLNRMVGKVKEQLQLTTEGTVSVNLTMPANGREAPATTDVENGEDKTIESSDE